jgi:hypothetical protein
VLAACGTPNALYINPADYVALQKVTAADDRPLISGDQTAGAPPVIAGLTVWPSRPCRPRRPWSPKRTKSWSPCATTRPWPSRISSRSMRTAPWSAPTSACTTRMGKVAAGRSK